jgi:ketosteroid isomerase-like protein
MAVWTDDDEVVCVHPGGPRMVGRSAIRAAFDAIFAQGRIQVTIDRVRRVSHADAAVHSVVERVDVLTEQGPRTAYVMSTNVYLRTALGWRIVAHHASPGTPAETPEINDAPSVLH